MERSACSHPSGGVGAGSRDRAAVESPRSALHRWSAMDRRHGAQAAASPGRVAGQRDHAAATHARQQYAAHALGCRQGALWISGADLHGADSGPVAAAAVGGAGRRRASLHPARTLTSCAVPVVGRQAALLFRRADERLSALPDVLLDGDERGAAARAPRQCWARSASIGRPHWTAARRVLRARSAWPAVTLHELPQGYFSKASSSCAIGAKPASSWPPSGFRFLIIDGSQPGVRDRPLMTFAAVRATHRAWQVRQTRKVGLIREDAR